MKSLKKRWVFPAAALLVAVGGYAMAARRGRGEADAAHYVTARVQRSDVASYVSATGVIQPWKVVDVKSDIGGRIEKMAVDLGDHVKSGQLIALIDPTDARAAAEQAGADLTAAVAKRDGAAADAASQVATTQAHVTSAEQALQDARVKEAEAAASMRAQPKLTAAAIQQAQSGLGAAQQALAQARQSERQLEEQLAELKDVTLPMAVETAQGDLQQAQANAKSAAADYERDRQLLAQGYSAQSAVDAAYAKLATLQAAARNAEQRAKTVQEDNRLQQQQTAQKVEQAQAQIAAEQQHVRQAEAALQAAQDNAVQDQLRRDDYQAAVAGVAQAEAALAAARAEYDQDAVKQKDVVAAQAQITHDQATVQQANTNLGYTRVVAPRDGVVIAKNVEEGTVVPSSRQAFGSTSALVQIGDVSRLWVVCNVDETDIRKVQQGQDVQVSLDAYPGIPLRGHVIRIDPQSVVQQNVTLIPVTVELAQPDPRFKPGMNATCRFIQGEAKNVLAVPAEAVKDAAQGGHYVRMLLNGKPQPIPVEIGVVGQDLTEIRSGLQDGDQVITHVIQSDPKTASSSPLPGGLGGGTRGGFGSGAGGIGGGRGR